MMAEAVGSIFNKKASEKLKSPDDLDKYLRVTNPSVWVILAACAVLLCGLLAWGFFGAVSTSVTTTAVQVDGKVVSFLDAEEVSKVTVGDTANVNGQRMKVAQIASLPVSVDEAKRELNSDYLVSVLVKSKWAYMVTYEGESDLEEGMPATAVITVERVAPISLIWGNAA